MAGSSTADTVCYLHGLQQWVTYLAYQTLSVTAASRLQWAGTTLPPLINYNDINSVINQRHTRAMFPWQHRDIDGWTQGDGSRGGILSWRLLKGWCTRVLFRGGDFFIWLELGSDLAGVVWGKDEDDSGAAPRWLIAPAAWACLQQEVCELSGQTSWTWKNVRGSKRLVVALIDNGGTGKRCHRGPLTGTCWCPPTTAPLVRVTRAALSDSGKRLVATRHVAATAILNLLARGLFMGHRIQEGPGRGWLCGGRDGDPVFWGWGMGLWIWAGRGAAYGVSGVCSLRGHKSHTRQTKQECAGAWSHPPLHKSWPHVLAWALGCSLSQNSWPLSCAFYTRPCMVCVRIRGRVDAVNAPRIHLCQGTWL